MAETVATRMESGLSSSAFAQMLAPDTAAFEPWSESTYYGLGVIVSNGWIFQNPLFHGYAGVMAYLPAQDVAVAIFNTRSSAAEVDARVAHEREQLEGLLADPEVAAIMCARGGAGAGRLLSRHQKLAISPSSEVAMPCTQLKPLKSRLISQSFAASEVR